MNAAVIVAAGRGSRMGLSRNKVLYSLCGEPIVVRTVRAFVDCGLFDGGIVIGEPLLRCGAKGESSGEHKSQCEH